jgi:hypothetical protein
VVIRETTNTGDEQQATNHQPYLYRYLSILASIFAPQELFRQNHQENQYDQSGNCINLLLPK